MNSIAKQYRQTLDMSYREMASALGISHQTVYNWASGRHKPNPAFLLRLLQKHQPESWQYEFISELLAEAGFAFNGGHNA